MSKQGVRVNKWTPSYPVVPKDNIISSQSKANNEKGFIPSYESIGKPQMNFLMSEEYRRLWFKERGVYEKEVYTKKAMMKEESKIKRRFVQKCLIPKKREREMPIIHLKRFENIRRRIDDHRKKDEHNNAQHTEENKDHPKDAK
ncbi:uncharacterized protein [Onthophagus taurus]|uniref:uncharacterized protein n=1 Tax=Onthophagus taurus TaxID=166361 RepID=UPI000C209B75|nr:uncharacterized protein LOC111414596 [Onthophagus taurus]